jgi:6-phosphogluconolactonase
MLQAESNDKIENALPTNTTRSGRASSRCKVLIVCLLLPLPTLAATFHGWIGTYTTTSNKENTGSGGIYSFNWNSDSGDITDVTVAASTANPSFLVLHPNGKYLYSVNEDVTLSNADGISAFAIDARSAGKLTPLNSVSSNGIWPCYLSIDRTGKWLFVANYYNGTIAVYPIQKDGRLGNAVQVIQQEGSGPVKNRQDGPHAHEVLQSPDGHFLISVNLGADRVLVYRFNPANGRLTPNTPADFAIPAGYGPRHLIFSHDARLAYVVTEIIPSVITLRWNASKGTFTQVTLTSALPEGFTGRKSGAEIMLHPSGKFLYSSNRGDSNTIARFRIGTDGVPQSTGWTPSGGTAPRFFGFDPTGRFLIAAHQNSNDIYVFKIDPVTGALTRQESKVNVSQPVMFVFSK